MSVVTGLRQRSPCLSLSLSRGRGRGREDCLDGAVTLTRLYDKLQSRDHLSHLGVPHMSSFQTAQLDSLTELHLDPFNPRLRKDEEASDQAALIAIMLSRFKIEEVAESILAAGWLDQDPLMAVEEDDEVRVVEGNRRLTAVKLLLDPGLAPSAKQPRWSSMSDQLTDGTRAAITTLRVRIYADRDDPEVSSYIGFRHVTGVLPWPAMEKASYIARLASAGATYRELADKLGSYPSHMVRHHLAFQLVEQAEEWGLAGARQLGDAFGVLLRALQTEGVRTFLDLNPSNDPAANMRPVSDERREDFELLIRWTFGTPDQPRLLPESRELTKWSKILLSPSAVRYLKTADDPRFERAWARSGGESESVADALWKSAYLLSDVLPLVHEHRAKASVTEAVEEINRYLRQINSLLTMDDTLPHA